MTTTTHLAGTHDAAAGIGRHGWLVLGSAFLGWMFDGMDLHLFTMVMIPALKELTGVQDATAIAQYTSWIVAVKLLAWGAGGIVFGVLADRVGRARVMMITIVLYSVCTALSGLAKNWQQLMALQALAGLGIGGEWAAGAALIVETWPARYRPRAVQAMQAAMVFGLLAATLLSVGLAAAGWRWIMAAGALPAVLGIGMRWVTPESAQWRQLKAHSDAGGALKLGKLSAIFSPQLRRRTWAGTLMALAVMVGSWGGSTLLPMLIQSVFGSMGAADTTRAVGIAFMFANGGALTGFAALYGLVWRWPRVSRRAVFAAYCIGAGVFTWVVFRSTDRASLFVLMFGWGFFAVGSFGVLAMVLTEMFPTHVRATGQGFTWNAARLVTAAGPLAAALGIAQLGLGGVASVLACLFACGLVAAAFAPETRATAA